MKLRQFRQELANLLATEKTIAKAVVSLATLSIEKYHNNGLAPEYVQAMIDGLKNRPQLLKAYKGMVTDCTTLNANGTPQKFDETERKAALKQARFCWAKLQKRSLNSLTEYTATVIKGEYQAPETKKAPRIYNAGQQARKDLETKTAALQDAQKKHKKLMAQLADAETKLNLAKEDLNMMPEKTTAQRLEEADKGNISVDRLRELERKLAETRVERDKAQVQAQAVTHELQATKDLLAKVALLVAQNRTKVAEEIRALLSA